MHFYTPQNAKYQKFEKIEKNAGKNIRLHMCTKNHNHMSIVPEIWSERQNLLLFWAFFALLPPNNPENQNFEKIEKTSEDITILLRCSKNMLLFRS